MVVPRWQLHRLGEAVLDWLGAEAAKRDRIRRTARARMMADLSPAGERRALQSLFGRPIPSSSQTPVSEAPDRSQV
jgi:hypothetical protein